MHLKGYARKKKSVGRTSDREIINQGGGVSGRRERITMRIWAAIKKRYSKKNVIRRNFSGGGVGVNTRAGGKKIERGKGMKNTK